MKTRRSGSRSGWRSNHAARRAATSGRACSLACAVFFDGQAMAIEEAPDRARGKGYTVLLPQQISQLSQCDVGLRVDRGQDDVLVGFKAPRAPVTALRLGARRAGRVPLASPANRARSRHAEPL